MKELKFHCCRNVCRYIRRFPGVGVNVTSREARRFVKWENPFQIRDVPPLRIELLLLIVCPTPNDPVVQLGWVTNLVRVF